MCECLNGLVKIMLIHSHNDIISTHLLIQKQSPRERTPNNIRGFNHKSAHFLGGCGGRTRADATQMAPGTHREGAPAQIGMVSMC